MGMPRLVFRYVTSETVSRLYNRTWWMTKLAWYGFLAGFVLFAGFYDFDSLRRPNPSVAETLGIAWILPYPNLIPAGIMIGCLGLAAARFTVGLLVSYAEADDSRQS